MTSNVSDIFRPAQPSTLQIGNAWPGNSRADDQGNRESVVVRTDAG